MKSNIPLTQFNKMTQSEKMSQLRGMAKIYNQKISRLEKTGNISVAKHYTESNLQKQSTKGFSNLTKSQQKQMFNKLRLGIEDQTTTNQYAKRILKNMGVKNISEYNEQIGKRFEIWSQITDDVTFTYEEKIEMIYNYKGDEKNFKRNLKTKIDRAKEKKQKDNENLKNALDENNIDEQRYNNFYEI